MMCEYKWVNTAFGYAVIKTGCKMITGYDRVPLGWTYCPFCGEKIKRGKNV